MGTSLSRSAIDHTIGFSVLDQLSYSDRSLPFGHVPSADRVRERFADRDVLFGYGENDSWNTGVTLWSFIGQMLQDGRQRSCNAAVTHAGRYLLEHGLQPPSPDSGPYCRARHKLKADVLRQLVGEIAEHIARASPGPWRWHQRHVKIVDDALPEHMEIRIVTFEATTDHQTEPLQVVTTLLDPETYPAAEIGQLYGYRWHAELDIFSIKHSLHPDHLRCQSPEMIRRELWTTLLAYNLVRLVCAQAAFMHDKLPRQMSFTLGCNTLLSQWLMPPDESIRHTLGRHHLFQIACHEVGNRPGRIEPRVIKRRPKPYKLMTKPRNQYKQAKP